MVTSGFGQFVRGSGFAVLHARGHTPSETVVVPLQGSVDGYLAEEHTLSPNPPKDTDGRREGSGRGWVRELQGRWPGLLG